MSLSKLPSGRWRAQLWVDGKNVSAAKILGDPRGSYGTKREARAAREKARTMVSSGPTTLITVQEFWERWTTDPLYARPKESTSIHNRERTRSFVKRYGTMRLSAVSDITVAEWISQGRNLGTIPALRAMFNDAAAAKSGRLIARNPFAALGIAKTKGNKDVTPPSQAVVRELIEAARRQSGPSFAAWLEVAAYTGMRPGEVDALRWTAVDFERNRILVAEQFSQTSGTFTLPKNGRHRYAPLTGPARAALLGIARESEFCFVNLRGHHWTSSARAFHWKAVRAEVGYTGSLYLATRHFAGAFMTNILGLPAEDVAIALGHTDGGQLIRSLYGHRDNDLALDRVLGAYDARSNVVEFKPKREESA